MIIQYMKNTNNGMFYKAVANSVLFMWSPNLKSWIKPCTSYTDMKATIENYELVPDKRVELFKSRGYFS